MRFLSRQWSDHAASILVARSILVLGIYELWGRGTDYSTLHADIKYRTSNIWADFRNITFRFEMDCFQGRRNAADQAAIMETLGYMGFQGRVTMKKPDHQFFICEQYPLDVKTPTNIYFGRWVADSGRKAMNKYDLKKRAYIATTSMNAELSLVTANLALAAPGTLAYDPFMGTGSFPVSCAHFGATVCGSDLDGRSIRGKPTRNVQTNFDQYALPSLYLGGFVADITNTPLHQRRILDSIVCDPPYGVREGLKVLGSTRVALKEVVYLNDGTPAHLGRNYIPPKKPYSFVRMLDDILDFSSTMLVDGGRLCMWMPVAGSIDDEAADRGEADLGASARLRDGEEAEYAIPAHPALKLISHCRQDFNKWSRRLLTYSRLTDGEISEDDLLAYRTMRTRTEEGTAETSRVNDLNDFRRRYFEGFKTDAVAEK
nr:trna (guanine(10)-n2)-methyltransferase [Quercus suber]